MKEFEELVGIMKRLRRECPWDKEQDLGSLRSFLLEESYEVLDAMNKAIETEEYEELTDELGDLLLQVLFQSELLSEKLNHEKHILSVILNLQKKLIRRHPHIFDNPEKKTAQEVLKKWDEIKAAEKTLKAKSLLDDVPKAMTPFQRAVKFGKRAKKVGFDWRNPNEVWQKVLSELDEIKAAKSKDEQEEELGDLLFCLAQWSRHLGIDPEVALSAANQKFQNRFQYMEAQPEFNNLSAEQKESLWNEAKKVEREKAPSGS